MPPPYGVIAKLLKQGQLVPFLGAGASFCVRPQGTTWEFNASDFPPSGGELARFLAAESGFPSTDRYDLEDLAKVASYFVATSDRPVLVQYLHEVLCREFKPGPLHYYLASIPASLLIVTTNYDNLIEKAFQEVGRPYDLVVHPTDRADVAAAVLWWKHGASEPVVESPNRLQIDLSKITVIYKMHGAVDCATEQWDSYVITEEDYVDFLSSLSGQASTVPAQFISHFLSRRFLFLGYSLRDWNLRVVLKNLKTGPLTEAHPSTAARPAISDLAPAGGLTSWAIQYSPSKLEEELWRRRRVTIYDVDINKFVEELNHFQL